LCGQKRGEAHHHELDISKKETPLGRKAILPEGGEKGPESSSTSGEKDSCLPQKKMFKGAHKEGNSINVS